MVSEDVKVKITMAEIIGGAVSLSLSLAAMGPDGLENQWVATAWFGASLYMLADSITRIITLAENDRFYGISEYLYSLPKRVYARAKNRGVYERLGRGEEFV